MKNRKQIALIILDGWGYREEKQNNAIASANIPYFKKAWANYPHALLEASGLHVGLPHGQMGNSEIGHTTIGAGKVIDTDLVRIKKAINSGEFEMNKAFTTLIDHVNKNDSTLHIMGLLGDGGVHAHSEHLFAFLMTAKNLKVKRISIHVFTDGRDTAPKSALKYMTELENVLGKVGIGRIATVSGRFYAMDRDNNWDRVSRVEKAIFECDGNKCSIKPSEKLAELYSEGKIDEHIEPMVFIDENEKGSKVEDKDGIFFFNFRADRARMISSKVLENGKKNICFVTMTQYFGDDSKKGGYLVAFPQSNIEKTLASEISAGGLTQAHIAETEKFPHATYFLNGGKESPHDGEEHILLDSRKDVQTHDLAPRMRAEAIADKAIEEINAGTNFIFINFANPDMVGHTANVKAIIEAVEEVDRQLKRVAEMMIAHGGSLFVTADHGNAEVNVDETTGEKHTAHTTNPVPAIFIHPQSEAYTKIVFKNGGLSDIAPTILSILDIQQPEQMTGKTLISGL